MGTSVAPQFFNSRSSKLFTIGQVLTRLEEAFPDLTPSKLRFFEDQGLVHPQRTSSGYRKFTEQDIDRVRVILELQRDRYWPLKVIGSYLSDLDAGLTPELPGAATETQKFLLGRGNRLSVVELMAETAISDSLLSEAQEMSILGQHPFDAAQVEIARALVQLQRFGIAPRHLRGVKASADREIGIIEGVIAPVLAKSDSASRSRAAHYALEIQSHFATIQSELVRSVISKIDS